MTIDISDHSVHIPSEGDVPPVQTLALGNESLVNILQITVVHDVTRGHIAMSASFPYIATVDDKPLLAIRSLLAQRFEEITRPVVGPDGKERMPLIWGEDGDQPGDKPTVKVLTPDLKSPIKMPTRIK